MTTNEESGRKDELHVEFEMLVEDLTAAFGGKQSVSLLMLSGGGSKGAWGAGVLNGWTKAATGPKRPEFDVVAGVSTGAIQATAAFLGPGPCGLYDQLLKEGYTTTTNSDVYGWPGFGVPRNLKALRKTLKHKYLRDDVLAAVATEAKTGRKVFAGTVDLESAQFCSWDLTKLAAQGRYDLYREVVLASSANPMGVWPIEIESKMHVDGGVRLRMFAETIASAARIAAAQVPGDKRAYYIVNSKLHKEEKKIPRNWVKIVKRSLDIMMKEAIYGSLYATWHELNGNGLQWSFHGSSIPQELKKLPDNAGDYDPKDMTPLYDEGYKWGSKNVWLEGLPTPDHGCRKP